MRLTRTSAPAVTPVSLTDAKTHLRISNTKSDTTLTSLVAVAAELMDGREGILRRALITQSWRMTLDAFPAERGFRLPLPPLQTVDSIQYYDADNVLQTLATSEYVVIIDELFGRVELATTASWPSTYDRDDAVLVTFTAGYGATAAAVPEPLRHAMLLYVAELYSARGDAGGEGKIVLSGARSITPAEASMGRLLAPYKIREFPSC